MAGQGLLQVGLAQAGHRRVGAGQDLLRRCVRAAGRDFVGPAVSRAAGQQLPPGQLGGQRVEGLEAAHAIPLWRAYSTCDAVASASARTDLRASSQYVTPPKNSPMNTLKSEPSTRLDSGDT